MGLLMLKMVASLLALLALFISAAPRAEMVYFSVPEALSLAFADEAEEAEIHTLWLNDEQKNQATRLVQRPVNQWRIRYWQHKETTLWLLDEIGKTEPISFAVAVKDNKLLFLRVMVFRESRGSEIRSDAYTKQFNQLALKDDRLTDYIDGVTGATLSVRASKKAAKLALLFHQMVTESKGL